MSCKLSWTPSLTHDSVHIIHSVVRDLFVYLDNELSMKNHVNKIASACFYHIRRLRQIRHYVSREVLKQLATSLVLSRLDYCNSVLVAASTLMPLQRAQNAAARLVLGLDRRSYTTAALQDLHWLPVKHRITFKIASLMHQVLHQRCPTYLSDLVVASTTPSALSDDFVPQPPELPSFDEPGLSESVRTTGLRCLWSRHLERSSPSYPHHRLLPCFPAFAKTHLFHIVFN